MNEFQTLETMASVGAILTNSHIVYTSGRHGDSYVNKDALYPHTDVTSRLCETIAKHFSSYGVDAVIAPAIGGVILSQWIAHHLSTICGKKVFSLYAEKSTNDDSFLVRRGYEKMLPKKKILIAEDVLTTGGSVKKVIQVCREFGADVVGVAALCNRGEVTATQLGVKHLHSLVKVSLASWEEQECPLCAKNVPVNVDVGKGREFLARKKS